MLCCAVLCCAVLCCAVLRCAVLCTVVFDTGSSAGVQAVASRFSADEVLGAPMFLLRSWLQGRSGALPGWPPYMHASTPSCQLYLHNTSPPGDKASATFVCGPVFLQPKVFRLCIFSAAP